MEIRKFMDYMKNFNKFLNFVKGRNLNKTLQFLSKISV